MARARKRRPTDALFFVELVDTQSEQRRVAVGNFWGGSASDALDQAMKVYPAFFRSLETHSWRAQAKEIQPPEKRYPMLQRPAKREEDLFAAIGEAEGGDGCPNDD